MTSQEHYERWQHHDSSALEAFNRLKKHVDDVNTEVHAPQDAAVIAAMAQAHATIAHTHAFMMIEGRR